MRPHVSPKKASDIHSSTLQACFTIEAERSTWNLLCVTSTRTQSTWLALDLARRQRLGSTVNLAVEAGDRAWGDALSYWELRGWFCHGAPPDSSCPIPRRTSHTSPWKVCSLPLFAVLIQVRLKPVCLPVQARGCVPIPICAHRRLHCPAQWSSSSYRISQRGHRLLKKPLTNRISAT